MGSLSAVVTSPAALRQEAAALFCGEQEGSYVSTSGSRFLTQSASAVQLLPSRKLFLEHYQAHHPHFHNHHRHQYSRSSSSSCLLQKSHTSSNVSEFNRGGRLVSPPPTSPFSATLVRSNARHPKVVPAYEWDISCPTSWEFQRPFRHYNQEQQEIINQSDHICSQMPATVASSHPVVLTLPLPSSAGGASSSSAASSLSTTPSPLDEHGPGSYQVQMQLSLLRSSTPSGGGGGGGRKLESPYYHQQNFSNGGVSTPTGQQQQHVQNVSVSHGQPQGVNVNVSNCGCAPNHNNNSTIVIGGGGHEGQGGDIVLDLTRENGSDGSRNSTGSHRSQDSGFSDSGETRRRKSSLSNNSHNGDLTSASMNQSNGNIVNGNYQYEDLQNSVNGYHHNNHSHNGNQHSNGYDYLNGNNNRNTTSVSISCCPGERPRTPSAQNGPVYGHLHHPNGHLPHHIYDSIGNPTMAPNMPSPIIASGFGCGQLVSTPNGAPGSTPHLLYRVVNNPTPPPPQYPPPPRRPASVDISRLDANGNCHGHDGVQSHRMSPLPPPTSCSNCTTPVPTSTLSSFTGHPFRRSFSPSSRSTPSHDISALASSSTATAMAALRVPLGCSTPKRSTGILASRFQSNGNSNGNGSGNNGNNIMLKIDNFESLNKNVNSNGNNNNKDNNNNSSNSGSAAATPKKGSRANNSNNKTFTIAGSGSGKDSSSSSRAPSRNGLLSTSGANGTVFCQEQSSLNSASGGEASLVQVLSKQSSAPFVLASTPSTSTTTSTAKSKTTAESIYDKICSRLSSFSSSTSSASSSVSALTTPLSKTSSSTLCNGSSGSSQNQTVILAEKNNKKKASASSELSSSHTGQGQSSLLSSQESRFKLVSKASSSSTSSTCSSSRLPLSFFGGSKRLSIFDESQDHDALVTSPVPSTSTKAKGDLPVVVGVEHRTRFSSSSTKPSTSTSTSTQSKPTCTIKPWKAVEDKAESAVVRLWLHDLRSQTEPECLHSLQTKWIVPAEFSQDEEDEDVPSRSTSPTISSSTMTAITGAMSSISISGGGFRPSTSSSPAPSSSSSRQRSTTTTDDDYGQSTSDRKKCSSRHASNKQLLQRRSQQKFLSSMTTAIHAISTPLMSIRNVEMTANIISGEFSKICKHLEFGVFTQVPTLVVSLVGHIEDFLKGYHDIVPTGSNGVIIGGAVGGAAVGFNQNLKKLEGRLENACCALDMAVKSMSENASLMTSSDSSSTGRGNVSENKGKPAPPPRSSSASSSSSQVSTPVTTESLQECMLPSISNSTSSETESLDRHQYQVIVGEVVEGIVTVGNLFSQVVDLRLTRDLACILDTIEAGGIPGKIALKSLVTVLADGGNHICRLAADIRTVRGLLGVLLDTREDQNKILALRCLATVLCVGEAVKDFDKAGGFEIIADLLYEPAYSAWVKIEAVAVLTQATDPWIDLESTLITLGVHLEKFIVALTNLTREFKTDEEPFLLIVAAISNLTFLEVASTEYLKRCRTVSHLIQAVNRGHSHFSVFVLDHVATILANMAGVETCRQEIIQCGGIDALLQFLQYRPCLSGSKADSVSAITACERLQQKSTIALSRLSNEDGVARYVYDMGGVHRLVHLCRKEKERNFSDGVLIAALATLRKLVTICGQDAIKGLGGAEDLIEPRLLDSFLLYSSRQESYV